MKHVMALRLLVLAALLSCGWGTAHAQSLCAQPLKRAHGSSPTVICDPGDPGGGGGGTTPPANGNLVIGAQCHLPGPYADDRCTVMYEVHDNPANRIVCLWNNNSLIACEGRVTWGGGFDWVGTTPTSLEFRVHSTWPAQDPDWPNAAVVRAKGTLLKSQAAVALTRSSPTAACGTTVAAGGSIQAAIDSGVTTICLSQGQYPLSSALVPRTGQTIRSANASQPAILKPAAGVTAVSIGVPGVTVKNLSIESSPSARAEAGVAISGGSDALVDGVDIAYARMSITINASSNVEVRNSEIDYGGDGQACSGCANPSIWINGSSDVRIVKSALLNNATGPEGDGELACYNTSGLVLQNSTITGSGASGVYLVNCDNAIVIGNLISHAQEWGLDIVKADQASGTDFGLFQWNQVEYSRNGGGVLKDSRYDTFTNNTYVGNRAGPNASGSCNGINLRGDTTGFYSYNDTGNPWPVYCSD